MEVGEIIKTLERNGKKIFAGILGFFLGADKTSPEVLRDREVRNLLVIRQQNQMGDMLLAVPALRGIRHRFPEAEIYFIAATINAEVVRNNPFIDELIVYSKKKYLKNPISLFRLIMGLRRKKFDLVIVLNTVSFSVTSMLLAVASGASIRAGVTSRPFGTDLSERFYHIELPLPPESQLENMHESEHNLFPLAVLDVEEPDLSSILVPTDRERQQAEEFIREEVDGDFILVHPGAGKAANIWPPANFAAASDYLARKYSLDIVVVEGPADERVFHDFVRSCPSEAVFLRSPSVGCLGAVMTRAAVTLCNDTGIMHIAGAVGAPSVAVFGPTDPDRWKPAVNNVTAVRADDHRVESVAVEEVISAAEEFLTDN